MPNRRRTGLWQRQLPFAARTRWVRPESWRSAGGHVLGVQGRRPGRKKVELDLVVAGDAGMGGASVAVLGAKVVDNVGLELPLDVENVMRDSQSLAHPPGVFHVVQGTAPLVMGRQVGLVQAVQLHGHADHVVSPAAQQQGRHRRIHPAAHCDDNFFCHRINRPRKSA